MDIDNFEWWYSEGEAPDEEWDEPTPRGVSSDEDETGNDVAADSDAALDPVEPLTFEQAWAQAEADEAKADATATLGEPADMSISRCRENISNTFRPRFRLSRRTFPSLRAFCLESPQRLQSSSMWVGSLFLSVWLVMAAAMTVGL